MTHSTDTQLSRRSLLAGLAVAASAALPQTARATPDNAESATLRKLVAALPRIDQANRGAQNALREAYRTAMRAWPDSPEEIRSYAPYGLDPKYFDLERDVKGSGRDFKNAEGETRYLRKALPLRDSFSASIIPEDRRQMLFDHAAAYEKACKAAREASGYHVAKARAREASDALRDHVSRIMAEPVNGMAGVMIKAQALDAWGCVSQLDKMHNLLDADWATALAADILRIATEGNTA